MFSVINAFFVLSIYSFLLYSCLSNNESEEVESQGWIMIVVVIVFNGVSFLAIFIFKCCEIRKKCKERKVDKRLQAQARYKLSKM